MNPKTAVAACCAAVSLLVSSANVIAEGRVEITEPVTLFATDTVARTWASFDVLPSTDGPKTTLSFDTEPPTGRARVDILVRRLGQWFVASSANLTSDRAVALPRDERLAVLARFEQAPSIYAWADTDRVGERLTLDVLRNVRIVPPDDKATDAVFFANEVVPLTCDSRMLRGVPVSEGLLCLGSACALLSASDDVVSLQLKNEARVLRSDTSGNLQALAPGLSPLRASTVATDVIRSGKWSAVTLSGVVPWNAVVLDVAPDGAALQRLPGAGLAPPPSWTDVVAITEKGLIVRPLVGPEKTPHRDAESKLYVFPDDTAPDDQSRIPIASATLENGVFTLPELGYGRYLLKLISSETTGALILASLSPSAPSDVEFARGPVIRGRVVRTYGGSADDPISVEIVRQTPIEGSAPDVADWVRAASADEQGNFRVVLTVPGPYRLRARWGAARGEVAFHVKDIHKDVDLGDVNLDVGAVIRGTLSNCKDGELRMAPIPDLTKPMTVPFFDYRRISVAVDGTFSVDGLTQGQWTVSARCDGVSTVVTPSIVVIPASGVTFLDLHATSAKP